MTIPSGAAIQYIRENNLIGIKAGQERDSFLSIWMVVVDNRIFARSWGLAERSWYNTFLTNAMGEMQCGETVYAIQAVVPADIQTLQEKINEAYTLKYNYGQNIKYVSGIKQPQHMEKTMEFIVVDKKNIAPRQANSTHTP